MDKYEQRKFVTDLLDIIGKRIIYDIDRGAIPKRWDGVELRWLMESIAGEYSFCKKNGRRWREFNNDRITKNI